MNASSQTQASNAQAPRPTLNTQKGNTMNAFVFATYLAYTLITALYLGDYGWTPIVGIPWAIINIFMVAYVIRSDWELRR